MNGCWSDISRFIAQYERCAIVTVVELFGSGPREIGARMIIAPDGTFTGTIGGGTLEWQALAAAQAMAPCETRIISERKFGLGPDLGQCCGGYVTLAYEQLEKSSLGFARKAAKAEAKGPVWIESLVTAHGVDRRIVDLSEISNPETVYDAGEKLVAKFGKALTPVYLFGAGHVGQALVSILKKLPLQIVWLDSRDIEIAQNLPSNVSFQKPSNLASQIVDIPQGCYVYVMTHSHALDFELSFESLQKTGVDYVGVIGSKTKKARFEKRLREAGLNEMQMQRFHCPLGLESIHGKEPAVIAVSIAADLVQRIEARSAIENQTKKIRDQPQEQLRESG